MEKKWRGPIQPATQGETMKFRNAFFGIAIGLATFATTPGILAAQEPWEGPPGEYQRDIQRQGFHDGIEGARKDFQNHRRPDVNNRDEYKHPQYHGRDRDDYREAFRRGYDVGVQHIYNGGPR